MIFTTYADNNCGLFDISIVSCGHIFAQEGREIHRPNGRDDWLLFYVLRGNERFYLNTVCDANDGDFVIFKPYETQHHICISHGISEYYYIHFQAPLSFDLFGFESSKVHTAKPSSTLRDLFEEITDELQNRQPAYEKICVAKIFNILSQLIRCTNPRSDLYNRRLGLISYAIQHMNKHYAQNVSLEEYAKMCNMSKFHFLRTFKSATGTSPLKYKNNLRIEHAKELLESGALSVSEIAEKTGFSSATYFCDAFKNKIGLSPQQYRQKSNFSG